MYIEAYEILSDEASYKNLVPPSFSTIYNDGGSAIVATIVGSTTDLDT